MSDTDLSSLCDDDTTFLLTNSCDERCKLTYADCNISDYQLEKLRFIAYSRLQVASVRDADCGHIYNELKNKYGQNSAMAASVLNMMLGVAGAEGTQSTATSLSGIDDFPDNGFEWRWKLIRYSDKAVQQHTVPEFVNYLYRVFNIGYRKDQYISAETPIQLFVYMIDEQILEVGSESDLRRVGKFFNLCNRSSLVKLGLGAACAVMLVGGIVSFLLLLPYTRSVKDISDWTEMYTGSSQEQNTVLVPKEMFDVRFHDKFRIDVVKNRQKNIDPYDYRMYICQRKCYPPMVTELQWNFTERHDEEGKGTHYIRGHYMVTGSELAFSYTPPSVTSTVTLNIFTDDEKCNQFDSAANEGIIPSESILFSSNNGFKATYRSLNDNFICFVSSFQDQGHYSYHINGTILNYQSASGLNFRKQCNLYYSLPCQSDQHCSSSDSLSRSWTSKIATQTQPTCFYLTIGNIDSYLYLNISTTVFATNKNINVLTPPVVGCVLVALASVLVVALFVVSCKSSFCYLSR